MEVSDRSCEPIVEESAGRLSPGLLVARTGPEALRLAGELDIAGVPVLRAGLAGMDGDIEMDCSGLTFIDCAGLKALEDIQRDCQARGSRLYLNARPRCLTRLLDLVGLHGCFDLSEGQNQ